MVRTMAGGGRWVLGGTFAALVLVGAACGGGGRETSSDPAPSPTTTAPPQAPTASGLPPGSPDLAQMVETITRQLEQATTGPAGTPQPATPEEISALLKAQMEQYLNQTKTSGTADGK